MFTRRTLTLGLFLALVVSCFWPLRDARACGMFVAELKSQAPPRMEHERTLILWDAASHRQHFVREVRFTSTGELPFGFIVPTPARPEVNDVKSPPFDALQGRFPHTLLDTPESDFGAPGGKGQGEGVGRGIASGGGAPVQVLEKKRVGDFTSFVLAATDAKALADWLKKNKFRASEAGQKWIERYVKLGFFFVALRYEGKKVKLGEEQELVSRSLRLSFDTPLPYYPYEEPADAPDQSGRELQVWLVTQGVHVPLAPVVRGGRVEIRRPWSEGVRYEGAAEISSVLGADLGAFVPAGAQLQTFGDWKQQRQGFGDLILVPARAEGCDATCVTERRPLMVLLDPTLTEVTPAPPSELVIAPPAPRTPTTWTAPRQQAPAIATGSPFGNSLSLDLHSGLACGIAKTPRMPGLGCALMLGAVGALALRRRSLVLACAGLALVLGASCAKPPTPLPNTAPVAAGSAAPSASAGEAVVAEDTSPLPGVLEAFSLPSEAVARQRAVMGLLAGHPGDKLIPVWSNRDERGMGHARHQPTNAVRDVGAIEQRCAADPRVEGLVSYVVDSNESGAPRALVEGPMPKGVLGCVEAVLVGGGPRIGRGVERGVLSLGPLTPETIALRRSIKDAKLGVGVPRNSLRLKRISTTVSAGLPREVVDRILRQHFARFRQCYANAQHPANKGQVTLSFDIGRSGTVTSMAASTADVAASTGICMGNATRALSFPRPEGQGAVKVRVTIGFENPK